MRSVRPRGLDLDVAQGELVAVVGRPRRQDHVAERDRRPRRRLPGVGCVAGRRSELDDRTRVPQSPVGFVFQAYNLLIT
jgi:hypothetical protein